MLLTDVALALSAAKVRYAIVGGYAVALHGAVRGTVDLDIVLAPSEKNYVAAETALKALGLTPRLPLSARELFQSRHEYAKSRNLVAWSFCDFSDPTRLVDIIITFDEQPMRTQRVVVGGVNIPLLRKSSLIAMKRASGRPQDFEDIRALERLG